MFKFNELKRVHIEITNRCQASCPMCPRNIHGGIKNPLLKFNDWTIDDFIKIFNNDVLKQIKVINFCGDFGDPMLNNDLILMCQYIKDNSNLQVDIHTNGGARNSKWWSELAKSLPENHTVYFALDGLGDTHHLYRVGTKFNTVIKNAKTFINSGGNAEWVFIEFKHNQHQIEEASELAYSLGFKSFKSKTSKRFNNSFPVLKSNGKVDYMIDQNSHSRVQTVTIQQLEDYKNWKKVDSTNCFADVDKELYIDAHFTMMPCCIIAAFLYTNYDKELHNKYNLINEYSIINLGKTIQDEVYDLVNELGGFDKLDANRNGIKMIMDSDIWQTLIKNKWIDKTSSPCIILCSNDSPYLKVKEQWNK